MISTDRTRVKIKEVVSSQLPSFVRDNYPSLSEFLEEYYSSQEYSGSPLDLLQNIDQYFDLDSLINHTKTCILDGNLNAFDTTISVAYDPSKNLLGTYGFPDRYGLLQIGNEIILYKSKTDRTFEECVRGFSGISKYESGNNPEQLVFSETDAEEHSDRESIENLSVLFLEKFLIKLKNQFLPGFEGRDISPKVNQKVLIGKISDFYDAKGTEESIRILFATLYGENVKVINPKDFLFKPSSPNFRRTKDIVVEALEGNPLRLKNRILVQDSIPKYGIKYSEASVSNVEVIKTDTKDYYRMQLDYEYDQENNSSGNSTSPFVPHSYTKLTSPVSLGSTIFDVDSTIGFPTSGDLVVSLPTGDSEVLSYTSKSLTQFFGITPISPTVSIGATVRLNVNAYGYPGISTSDIIKVRIGSVLKKVNLIDDGFYFSNGDIAKLTQPGIANTSIKANNWILNIPIRYNISELTLIDFSNLVYRIKTHDDHIFYAGDAATLIDDTSSSVNCTITSIIDKKTFTIRGQGNISLNGSYSIQRKIKKTFVDSTLTRYSYANDYNSDIQNTYLNFSDEVLVATPSIPSYKGQPLSFYDRVIPLNGSFNGNTLTVSNVNDHGFYTGDSVYYNPGSLPIDVNGDGIIDLTSDSSFSNVTAGTYFVQRINKNQLKLAKSRSDIYNNNFINISGIVTSNFIGPANFKNLSLKPQNLLRLISEPNNESGEYDTPTDSSIGVFINGVELTNYKSSDFIRFGEIEKVEVDSSGDDYDIINPPVLRIYDRVGTGATGSVSVRGSLKRIEIIDEGFDYVSDPIIDISGGNGFGAEAKANTTLISHSASFFAEQTSDFINLTNNTIGFSTFHKFRSVEQVIYRTDGEIGLSGLSTNSYYYAKTIDSKTVKLFQNENDAVLGINTISLGSYGIGVHRLESVSPKKIITSVLVLNPGENYQNKERTCNQVGVITALNQINIKNHGYQSREVVVYSTTGGSISGLSTSSRYIVTKIDEDNFKLSQVGIASTNKYFYFDTQQYVNIISSGSGTHIFNYEPITVSISGRTGVATVSNQNFGAILQPVFRGEIESVNVRDGGIGYGSSEILNYNKQPNYELLSGKDAELIPIVNNGSIVEVIVNYGGEQYNSPPDLLIQGTGNYAILTPILRNGRIFSVKVVNGGIGYDESTSINVVSSGRGASLSYTIKQWNVNLFQKNLDIISSDDGILKKGLIDRYEIQYAHVYTPRKLRESVYQKTKENETKYGVFDLQKINNQEVSSGYHSPIIGWAYDGNPIYGPYGFNSITGGGSTRLMKSGYKLVSRGNRPVFPLGFFVEDYEFDNSGDLDEHNGRYCVTPEYPNGTYAYFTTVNDTAIDDVGTFAGYRKPTFPYVIGNTFKSKPINFNFSKFSNQDDYDLTNDTNGNKKVWLRNTTQYNLTSTNTFYDFIDSPLKENNYTSKILSVSDGQIESVIIEDKGSDYKVGDKVVFDNSGTGGSSASAFVSKVDGKTINSISVASTTLYNAEISPNDGNGKYIALLNSPHGFSNGDLVTISGINTSSEKLNGSYKIGVTTETYSLSVSIGNVTTTGIVTYISLSGNLNFSKIREDDVLQIESEKVKVLNLDSISSRVRVLRAVDGTTGSAHTATTAVREVPRKFTFNSYPELNVTFERNKKVYFNPKESVGLGTVSGVGIGSTIVFSSIGAGISQIFVPTKTIYLPGHGLLTGDSLTYSNNNGSSIVVSNGSTTFSLQDSSVIYAANVSDNLLGISTVKIGIGTTGTFIGIGSTNTNNQLLYFVGFGTGTYHSFETNKQYRVLGEVVKNTVTVSTASTHNLKRSDSVDLEIKPSTTNTVVIKYNDYNRRIVVNPKNFIASGVNTEDNTILIQNHNLKTGDKVIHTSFSPCGGLQNEKIYYVIKHTKDLIKLSSSKYGSQLFEKEVVNITSASFGTLSPINPKIDLVRNSQVIFDLSDSSLSSTFSSRLYSSFDFKIYTDEEFTQEFYGTLSANSFNISRIGQIGISTNASIILKIDERVPSKLFYNLVPINQNFSLSTKKDIVIDNDVVDKNLLNITLSKYSGTQFIVGIASTAFTYQIAEIPESNSYVSGDGTFKYTTTSKNASGGISSIRVNYGGYGYKQLPGISTVVTDTGKDSILKPFSSGIGTIISTKVDLIGYDYPNDKTLRPLCNLPEVFEVRPFNRLSFVGVTSSGNGYSLSPGLVLIDEYENKVVTDVDLKFTIGKNSVDILKNTEGINGKPKIIPINNSNGVRIKSLSFNPFSKNVTVGLNTGFSDVFPFSVGDKVLIENISVGIATTARRGYNSENYNYKLFTLTNVPAGNTGLGGNVGVVTFSMSDVLEDDEFPGTFDPINSSGRMIAEKDFPIFDVQLKKSSFAKGETIYCNNKTGTVESWNEKVNILKVSSKDEFSTGDIIKGIGTKTVGVVGKKYNFNSFVDIGATSEEVIGWENEFGFLNSNLQRIPDNEYYQNFSYSLSSKISYENWNEVISSLSHASGFVKFSDLQIESSAKKPEVKTTNFVDVISDVVSEMDLSCYKDYDAVFENKLNISNKTVSTEIYFSNRVLTDYFESTGNRVLTIDDFSNTFNSDPRATPYSIIDVFNINQKVKKYFTYVRDRRFTGERQALFVSVVHDGSRAYLNQYGRVETTFDLGSFDMTFSEGYGYLLFYPTLFEFNDYDISYISFDIESTVSGIGSTSLGDTVKIWTQNSTVSAGSTSTVVSINNFYRASKVIVELNSIDSGRREIDELNIIHDGTNVELLEYGQMTTFGISQYESIGLGTYSAYISGSDLNVDFSPYAGIGTVNVNSIIVSIANTSSTGVGTHFFGFEEQNIAFINSSITSIASTSSPTENIIATYNNVLESDNQHDASYFLICVEDVTNGAYQFSEAILVDDESEAYLTEYGNIETVSSLGTVGAGAGTTYTNLYFTPNPDIDVQVRVFQASLQLANPTLSNPEMVINLNNGKVNAGFSNYKGTYSDVKKEFGLTHKGKNIFERYFFGNQSSIIDVSRNTISLPEHFFVTGEELTYSHAGAGTSQAIGIATTDFGTGIGITDKLPSKVYAIKINEKEIKLAKSAEDALKANPIALDIVSVGIGTSHSLTGKNQNGRCLVAIDNLIQSPIVETSVTTTLARSVTLTDDILKFSGITSFFSGDLIKINDEIMRVRSVGFGSTNQVLVRRPWMGTGIATHAQSSTVIKLQGNYNIVNNNINFAEAPKGKTPIGSSTNPPDERDWTGITTHSKFQGRTFLRSGITNSLESTYSRNYVFDDISEQFNAVSKVFTLKSNKQNITGFSTNNSIILVNSIFQGPQGSLTETQDYQLSENSGITSITFLGAGTSVSYDPKTATVPVGGVIVSVGSTSGFGYQPLVSAGGTAIVSTAGTISAISIGNSGSGYRAGIQTVVNVGVYTSSTGTPNIKFIGTAAVSNGRIVSVAITNPGFGYTSSNPPFVKFDAPLSYENIPLTYSSSSTSGLGTEARINIVVGQGSSVIDFEIVNFGYRYGNNEILTVATGGLSGIPTDTSKPFSEFKIKIEKTVSDSFSGWNIGELEVFDSIEDKFDGVRRKFSISKNGSPVTIRAKKGSNIDVQSTLLVFLNNILQVPGEGYTFTGGSIITFAEPPKPPFSEIEGTGDRCRIIFYKGSGDIDVQFIDVIETVKTGDNLTIDDSKTLCATSIQQEERLVTDVISSDTVETNPYNGPGITDDPNCIRTVTWCQQRTDKLVDGKIVGKSRVLYEPLVNPVSYIIKSVGTSSTTIYVDNIRPIYNDKNENAPDSIKNRISIISQDSIVSASATALVSAAGTVSSIIINNGGIGYSTPPSISIANPVGLGTTQRANAVCSVSSGSVNSINVSYGGTEYTSSNPPLVLIESPSLTKETNKIISYLGDSGTIVGFGTTTVSGTNKFIFEFFIPVDSYLRNPNVVSTATTISTLSSGDYFIVYDTNIGIASTSISSLDGSSNVVAIGKSFVDNVYYVDSTQIVERLVVSPGLGGTTGVGVTYVLRVYTPILDASVDTFNPSLYVNGISTTTSAKTSFGKFSWGKINMETRLEPKNFNFYGNNGVSGITSSTIVTRYNPLKYNNYIQ